jgi:hypothetical protein
MNPGHSGAFSLSLNTPWFFLPKNLLNSRFFLIIGAVS